MNDDAKAELSRTLALLAGAATSLSVALPAPGDIIARVIATGLGVVGLLLREGATVDEAIAAIRRVRHIDTRADDAGVDAKVAAKPSRDAVISAGFVGTGELSVGEIEAARMYGKLHVVEGGYGSVPRDWLARLRERVAKQSGTADTEPAPSGTWGEPKEGD